METLTMTTITSPGIYYTMTSSEYFSDPCPRPSLTQSLAKALLDQSALHAKYAHPRLRPAQDADDDEEKEPYRAALAIGNAAHLLMIGRGKQLAIGEFESWRTNKAKDFKSEATLAGKVPILATHFSRANEMMQASRLQLGAAGWKNAFRNGHGEVVLAWEEDGLWFRTMIDWMTNPTEVYDYKTGGGSFAPHVIGLKMEADGWDVQAAMHERALDALDPKGMGKRRFRYAAQENYPPYALVPVELNEHWLTMGRKKLEHAIGIWRQCMTSGIWQSYPSMPIVPDYPGYRESQWLDREVAYHDNLAALERRPHMLTDFSG